MKAIANILMICLCVILIYSFMKQVLPETRPAVQIYAPLKQQTIRDTVEITTVTTPPDEF